MHSNLSLSYSSVFILLFILLFITLIKVCRDKQTTTKDILRRVVCIPVRWQKSLLRKLGVSKFSSQCLLDLDNIHRKPPRVSHLSKTETKEKTNIIGILGVLLIAVTTFTEGITKSK